MSRRRHVRGSSRVVLLLMLLLIPAMITGRVPSHALASADTCAQGYVWREASPVDHVCVTPQTRAQAAYDNSQAQQRLQTPPPGACAPHAVYGLIGERWYALGGPTGPLGCPLTDELNVPAGQGRYNQFARGQIVWSPTTGPQSVQAAYQAGAAITVLWGDTSPFNYDFFIVR